MPGGMTGGDLARQIWKENPRLPVICISGYAVEEVSREFPAQENVSFLPKPFTAAELALAIRRRLDTPRQK